jgi:hypothetical protein
MAPGPKAARLFAKTFPFPGAWSALATLEILEACPPDAAHTGPDGDALRPVPLVVDVDAEFKGCYSVHGPGVPRGPAAYACTTLKMARFMISHVHGTAIYGHDPAAVAEEDAAQARDIAALDRLLPAHVKSDVATLYEYAAAFGVNPATWSRA